MKYFSLNVFCFILFFIGIKTKAQYQLKDSILFETNHITHLTTNNLGDVFLILDENKLLKINKKKEIKSYPLKKNVTKIDTNLSLRTGIVYNHQEIDLLDENLNPIQDQINFNQHQIFPSTISIVDSQLLFYFDPIEQRLVQWNYQLKSIINRSNLLFFKEGDSTIEEIYQYKNRIFLKSQNWIYEYDFFGNSKSTIQLKNHINYSFSDNYITLLNNNFKTKINLLTNEISTADNFFNVKDFTMNEDELFVIKNKGLYIYTRIKK